METHFRRWSGSQGFEWFLCTARPATTAAARPQKPPPENESRHCRGRGTRKTPAPLTQGLTKPPRATAQPAEAEPNPTGRATEPSVYITHPTHGARARPGKTQAPTGTWLTTLNADQCVHQPRGGRGRNRQPPPPQRKGRGGTRQTHSHETAHPHHKRRANPPATRHRRCQPWGPLKEHRRITR